MDNNTAHFRDYLIKPWDDRAIIHLDLDAFFASVAQLDNPDLRGKPVIVGGDANKRGVVSTCSYEARVYGVRSAMSSVVAQRLCPDAIWVGSDFARYQELSSQVMEIIRTVSPRLWQVSIDEAFADITPSAHNPKHPVAVAVEIQREVAKLGITASIGLANSMTTAKIGSDYKKPRGLTIILPGTEGEFLSPLPVSAMSGIGPKATKRLREIGIKTLGELALMDPSDAQLIMGSHGTTMIERACGIDVRPVEHDDPTKSVSNERTFHQDIRTFDELNHQITLLCNKVGARLRTKELAGRTLSIKVRFSDFTTKTVSRTLPSPLNNERIFAPIAEEMVSSVWTEGIGVRLLGVGISNFTTPELQLSLARESNQTLFENQDAGKYADEETRVSQHLVEGLDAIRQKYGSNSIVSGRQLKNDKPL